MKTAILTFQFAHNYGALLEAYALKQYLKSHDLEGEIAPYYPDWAQSEYAISPFAKGISFRRRVRLASQYWKRKGQSEVFDKFISEELDELFQMSDRIGVLCSGEMMAVIDRKEADYDTIGRLMSGEHYEK